MANTSTRPLRIGLVAGEASGDLLGASLITHLRALHPASEIAGVGGAAMREAGFDVWHDYHDLAIMGLAEVIRHLPRLLRLRKTIRERFLAWSPDVVIGIDAPDFNLGLERWLKKRGVTTIHYVSPSIWAWREGRAKKIQESVRRVLCLFPMEPPIYERYGVDARFVGHPLAQAFPLEPDPLPARRTFSLPDDAKVLAMLPGSRLGEIARLGAIFCAAAVRLRRRHPSLKILAPMANARCRAAFEAVLASPMATNVDAADQPPSPDEWSALREITTIVDGNAHQVMMAADLLLLASGTAALEGMLAKKPMAVAYRVSGLTYAIVKGLGLLKVSRYSLPNILSGRDLVPELMQADCTPDKISIALGEWIENSERLAEALPEFTRLHRELTADPSAAAQAVLDLLDKSTYRSQVSV